MHASRQEFTFCSCRGIYGTACRWIFLNGNDFRTPRRDGFASLVRERHFLRIERLRMDSSSRSWDPDLELSPLAPFEGTNRSRRSESHPDYRWLGYLHLCGRFTTAVTSHRSSPSLLQIPGGMLSWHFARSSGVFVEWKNRRWPPICASSRLTPVLRFAYSSFGAPPPGSGRAAPNVVAKTGLRCHTSDIHLKNEARAMAFHQRVSPRRGCCFWCLMTRVRGRPWFIWKRMTCGKPGRKARRWRGLGG